MLYIHLFGGTRLYHRDRSSAIKLGPIPQALLAYLLLHRRTLPRREVLAELFWGDRPDEQAQRCLRTTLWRLRQALEPADTPRDTYLCTSTNGEIGFNVHSEYWLDVDVFTKRVESTLATPVETMTSEMAMELKDALRLYTGDLLEGVYHDWALRERDRLYRMRLKSLEQLMAYYEHQGDCEASLSYGHAILDIDPLREDVHRRMMHLFMKTGKRPLAVRQYEACRQVLASVLDISPAIETKSVYQQIVSRTEQLSGIQPVSRERSRMTTSAASRDEEGRPAPASDTLTVANTQALDQLGVAVRKFDEAWTHLQQVLRLAVDLGTPPLQQEH